MRRALPLAVACSVLLALHLTAAYELHRVDTVQTDERLGITCLKSYEYALFTYSQPRDSTDDSGRSSSGTVGLSVRTGGTAHPPLRIDQHLSVSQFGDFARIECGSVRVPRAVDPHDSSPASEYSAYAAACAAPHEHHPTVTAAATTTAHERHHIATGATPPTRVPPFVSLSPPATTATAATIRSGGIASTIAAATARHGADARQRRRRAQRTASSGAAVSRAGFLMPQFYPHNETALARYIATHHPLSPDTLVFAVLTSFSMANFSATYLDRSQLSQCRLYAIPSNEQSLYPFVHVHRSSRRSADDADDSDRDSSDTDDGDSMYPIRGYMRWRDDGTAVDADSDIDSDAEPELALQPSTASSSLHATAIAITSASPNTNTASSAAGAVFVYVPRETTHCRRNAVSYHRTPFYHGATGGVSFIQTAAYLKMLGAALSGVMDIFTDTVMDIDTKHLEHTLMSEVFRVVNQRTTPQVLDLTWPPMRHNITNTVTDSVVQKTVTALAASMPNALGPYIVETAFDEIVPHAYNSLSKLLTQDISMELIRNMPTEVNRALSWSLTNKLTRSLTHALTATLTISLSHPTFPAEKAPIDQIACTQCFYNKQQCELCHSSSQFVYYSIYYSTYYADYYTDYYAPYFTNSMKSMDETRNPDLETPYTGDIHT